MASRVYESGLICTEIGERFVKQELAATKIVKQGKKNEKADLGIA